MPRTASTTRRPVRATPIAFEANQGSNVIPLRLTVMPRHDAVVRRWVAAGCRLGLLDAETNREDASELFVWVRENPDPAYSIKAERMNWVVVDRICDHRLGSFARLEEALFCIRPVCPDMIRVA